jgi:YidC/Oxa1 family membrane protein insertase
VAQLPVFWSLFNVLKAIADWKPGTTPQYGLTKAVVESAQEAKIFGVHLYDKFLFVPTGHVETWETKGVILAAVLISAATTFLTMKQSQRRGMLNQTTPDPDQPGAAAAAAMSKNMMYIAPFFALTGLYWQFGLVLYWVTTNLWTLGQQHFLFRNLPVVGSATVGASAVQAASGSTGAAARSGASSAAAKAGARPGGKAAPAEAKAAGSKGNAPTAAVPKAPGTKASANGSAAGAAANGSANGSSVLRRFGRGKQEPEEVQDTPPTKVVRQQPVRQTRSKRGNTGKR